MALARKIEAFEQRLRELELALEHELSSGLIDQHKHAQKLQQLETTRTGLEKLLILASIDEQPSNDNELGVPHFAVRTASEQKLFKNFFTARLNLAKKLYKTLQKISMWGTQALLMQGNSWTLVFRLSLLRHSVQEIERRILKAGNQNFLTDRQVNNLVASIQKSMQHRNIGPNLNGLIAIFTEMDQSAARVAKLKSAVFREQRTVEDMTRWLAAQEQTAKNPPATQTPPDVDALRQLEHEMCPEMISRLTNAKDRLALAGNFVKTYKQRESISATEKSLISAELEAPVSVT